MASATLNISVTITDTPSHPLVDVREGVLVAWNYLSGGGIGWNPLGTAQDKLNFIQAILAKHSQKHIKDTYIQYLQMITLAADVDIQ